MKEILKRSTHILPDKLYISLRYSMKMHKRMRWKNPQTFNEKLQWLKLHSHNPEYTQMVDKYAAKKYVADRVGEKYIIPTLGVWERFEDIDFEGLPDQFVLKCTHDSGGLVICRDKAVFDKEKAKKKIEDSLQANYYYAGREWPYKNVKPRIIAEHYLENDSTDGLHDYKVWCFGGKPIYVQYISGRLSAVTQEAFYDVMWEKQNFSFHNPLMEAKIARPACLNEMLRCCQIIAGEMPFVRIDFYVLPDDSIRFGEITFYPMSGFETFHPKKMDAVLGQLISLPVK